jgi:hypothetical protein
MKVILLLALIICSYVFNIKIKIKAKNYDLYMLDKEIGNSSKFVESLFSDDTDKINNNKTKENINNINNKNNKNENEDFNISLLEKNNKNKSKSKSKSINKNKNLNINLNLLKNSLNQKQIKFDDFSNLQDLARGKYIYYIILFKSFI